VLVSRAEVIGLIVHFFFTAIANNKEQPMYTLSRYVLMPLRLNGLAVLVLGVLFWAGKALNLVPLHMILGSLLVLQAWAVAGIAARAKVGSGRVILVFVWGLIVLAVGGMQTQWLPGQLHWIIQLVHLLLGLSLMAQAEVLGAKIKAAKAAS
jgi:hypothetical protein